MSGVVAGVLVPGGVFFAAGGPENRHGKNGNDHWNNEERGRDGHAMAPSESRVSNVIHREPYRPSYAKLTFTGKIPSLDESFAS